MKHSKKIILLLLFNFSISSCTKEEKKPTYDDLLEEHEDNEDLETVAKVVVGAAFCYMAYRSMKGKD